MNMNKIVLSTLAEETKRKTYQIPTEKNLTTRIVKE